MLTLYGIKNCDKVKKSRKWLDENNYKHHFHDYRSDGLDEKLLDRMVENIGWENMLNKRSASWRNLADSDREILDEIKAKRLMIDCPTLIKRPIIENKGLFSTGFSPDNFKSAT